MKQSKYYTPEIEEFHIGFEYERYSDKIATYKIDGKYQQTNFHQNKYNIGDIRLSQLGTYIFEKKVRVKYLDKEDIESLGWNKNLILVDSGDSDELVDGFDMCIKDIVYTLQIGMDLHIIITKKYYVNEVSQVWNVLFDGTVKNKSELKKLMNQLGIQ